MSCFSSPDTGIKVSHSLCALILCDYDSLYKSYSFFFSRRASAVRQTFDLNWRKLNLIILKKSSVLTASSLEQWKCTTIKCTSLCIPLICTIMWVKWYLCVVSFLCLEYKGWMVLQRVELVENEDHESCLCWVSSTPKKMWRFTFSISIFWLLRDCEIFSSQKL